MSNMFYSAEGNLCNNTTNKTTNDNNIFNTKYAGVNTLNNGGCKSPVNDPVYFTNYNKRDSATNKYLQGNPIDKSMPVKQVDLVKLDLLKPDSAKQDSVLQDAIKPVSTKLEQVKEVYKSKGLINTVVDAGSGVLSSFFGLFNDKTEDKTENKTVNVQPKLENFTEDKPARDYYTKLVNKLVDNDNISANTEYGMIQTSCNVVSTNNNHRPQISGYGVATDYEQVPVNYEILPSNRNKVCESCNPKACGVLPVPYEFDIMTDRYHLGPNSCVKTPE